MCCVSRHISDNWSVDGASFYFRASFWGCTLLGPLVWLLLSPNNPFAATVAFTFSVIVTILFVLFVILWDRCFDRHKVYVIAIANLSPFILCLVTTLGLWSLADGDTTTTTGTTTVLLNETVPTWFIPSFVLLCTVVLQSCGGVLMLCFDPEITGPPLCPLGCLHVHACPRRDDAARDADDIADMNMEQAEEAEFDRFLRRFHGLGILLLVVGVVPVINLVMLVLAFPLVRIFGRLLSIPQHIVTAGIVIFGIVGAATVRGNPLDVVTAVCFGILGLVFRLTGFPLAPLVIGLVLGPQFEQTLRRGLLPLPRLPP